MFIEYAILLAFVVVIGVFFVNDNGITKDISSIFNSAEKTLAAASDNKKDPKAKFAELVNSVLGKNLPADKMDLLGKCIISGGKAGDRDPLAKMLADLGIDNVFVYSQINPDRKSTQALYDAGLVLNGKSAKIVTIADDPAYKTANEGDKFSATQYLYYLDKENNKDVTVCSASRKVQVEVTKLDTDENRILKNGQALRYKFTDESGTVELGNNNIDSDNAINTNVSGWVKK